MWVCVGVGVSRCKHMCVCTHECGYVQVWLGAHRWVCACVCGRMERLYILGCSSFSVLHACPLSIYASVFVCVGMWVWVCAWVVVGMRLQKWVGVSMCVGAALMIHCCLLI